jgi:hypothetical protein
MDAEASSPGASRRSSRSHATLLVTLKLPPHALQRALNPDSLPTTTPQQPLAADLRPPAAPSPFPLASSPPTVASSPAPTPTVPKKRGGKRKAVAPGVGVFSVVAGTGENGGASGAGTPAPATDKEKVKPGPKANPGGINAQLRALDRSGRPTRKWNKVPFLVKTCAGYTFYSTTWVAPGMLSRPFSTAIPLFFPFVGSSDLSLVSEDGIYQKMQVDGPSGDGTLNEGDMKMENDKPLEQDAAVAESNPVAA